MNEIIESDVYESNSQNGFMADSKCPPEGVLKDVIVFDKRNNKEFSWKSLIDMRFNKKNTLICKTSFVDSFWFDVFNRRNFVFDLYAHFEFEKNKAIKPVSFLLKDCVLKDIDTKFSFEDGCHQNIEFVYGDMEQFTLEEGVNNGR